jgi:hypothetical protein
MLCRWFCGGAWIAAATAAWLAGWEWRFVVVVVTAPVVGAVVRRWSVLLLPLVLPAAAALSGEEIYDLGPAWQIALVLVVPPTVASLAAGVAVGRFVERWRASRAGAFR